MHKKNAGDNVFSLHQPMTHTSQHTISCHILVLYINVNPAIYFQFKMH